MLAAMTRFRLVAALALAGALALPATASATAATAPSARGSVGSANVFAHGKSSVVNTLAACTAGTVSTNGKATDFVTFGTGSSTCSHDAGTGAATVSVSGRNVKLAGLKSYGGPLITMSGFTITCTATETGTRWSLNMSGVTGLQFPSTIPSNYVITIPGASAGSPPLAKITLAEVAQPNQPDGSVHVNLMHVRLFPEGMAVDSGEVIVGSVHCVP
jgi:hypothetical protein